MELSNRKTRINKKLKYKVIICILSIAFSTILAELILANLYPQKTWNQLKKRSPRIVMPSDILPYQLRPNSTCSLTRKEFHVDININSHGYRDQEFDIQKGKKFRILAIGDSFTFGWGVSDTESYPNLLESYLNKELNEDRIQVINAGFASGYYPDTYYLYLKEIGLKLEPDLIMIGFFIGNDFDHAKSYENSWTKIDKNGLPLKIETPDTIFLGTIRVPTGRIIGRRYKIPVLRNSHLFHAILSGLKKLLNPDPIKYFNHWIYRKDYLERTNQIVQKVQKLLTAMADLAKDNNIPFLVVIIPAREQLYPDEYPFHNFPFMEDYDLDKPQRILREFLEKEQINYLDLMPLFKKEGVDPQLYYDLDLHWARYGHQVASRKIGEYLMRNGMLETK